MNPALRFACIMLLLLICAGCGPSNTVRMLYTPADSGVLPAPSAPSVTVVQFEDERPSAQLGVRRDNSSFVGNTPVAEWLSRSLADELARHGLQVSYAATLKHARIGNPAYIVTGVLEEAWLKESSATELSFTLRASMVVSGRKGRLSTEGLSASQSKRTLPTSGVAEELLLETMQELVRPAARKVLQAIAKK